jgi:DNA (cytosine-5)-methyltransferase 1
VICEVKPDIVSMENVPDLVTYKKGSFYGDFVAGLRRAGYYVKDYPEVFCPDYGIPQYRTRLVLFASRYGEIHIADKTHGPAQYRTVRHTIGHLEPIATGQSSEKDPLHKASRLSDLNLRRIRASLPGGTWRDWNEDLVTQCHRRGSGRGYASVYGRMNWDDLAPTITTQCYGFGSGRFGHPEQDRAISLREAALLQTFPASYQFVEARTPVHFRVVGRHIGNAVPVELGRVIARSIRHHLEMHVSHI